MFKCMGAMLFIPIISLMCSDSFPLVLTGRCELPAAVTGPCAEIKCAHECVNLQDAAVFECLLLCKGTVRLRDVNGSRTKPLRRDCVRRSKFSTTKKKKKRDATDLIAISSRLNLDEELPRLLSGPILARMVKKEDRSCVGRSLIRAGATPCYHCSTPFLEETMP